MVGLTVLIRKTDSGFQEKIIVLTRGAGTRSPHWCGGTIGGRNNKTVGFVVLACSILPVMVVLLWVGWFWVGCLFCGFWIVDVSVFVML